MKFTDGLFLRSFEEVAQEYKDRVAYDNVIVDAVCMQLVQTPHNFDVLVLPNLYGDIVSDLCAGLIGGLGIAPGANYGDDIALFEPVHGSAPKYAGMNKVNPTATILSGILMLRHLKEVDAANRLEKAVRAVLKEGKDVTYDLKADRNDPTAVGTMQMAQAICRKL
jgi:isocitrate dehydrogenase (NAD+)